MTVLYQDIGDTSVALGGDTSPVKMGGEQKRARRSHCPPGHLAVA